MANEEQSDYMVDEPSESDQAPENEAEKGETVLVPASALGDDVKPGDTVTFKVDHIYEEEIALIPVKEKDEDESPRMGRDMDMAMSRLGEMSEESEGMGY